MYGKIKGIVSEFVQEHELASKAKMDENFLTDMLTVALFNGLNQKEQAAPKPQKKKETKPDEKQTNLLNLNMEVAK